MTTLCIIDMQSRFSPTANYCLNNVCHQVKLAKKRKAWIVVIEYRNCGKTFKEIKSLLASYKQVIYVEKNNTGGGKEFLEAAKKANFNTNKVRFVGVNRTCCVLETVKEIIDLINCRVEIVTNATWCLNPTDGLKKLRELGKII